MKLENPYDSESSAGGDEEPDVRAANFAYSLTSPMKFWLFLIFISAVILLVVFESPSIAYASILTTLANILLLLPGSIVLPLLVALFNGIDIGNVSLSSSKANKAALYNGIYSSVIYLVAILILYETLNYVSSSLLPKLSFIIQYWVLQPVGILIVLPLIIATLAFYRKKSIGEMKKKS